MTKRVSELGLPPLNPGWSWEVTPTVGGVKLFLILWDDKEKRRDTWKGIPSLQHRSKIVRRRDKFFDSLIFNDTDPSQLTPPDFQRTAEKILRDEATHHRASIEGQSNMERWVGVYK